MGTVEIPINAVSVDNPADAIELEAKDGTLVAFNVGSKVIGEVQVFNQSLGGPDATRERSLVVRVSIIPGITKLSYPDQQGLRKALVEVNVPDGKRTPFPRELT